MKFVMKDQKPNSGLGQTQTTSIEINAPHIKWNANAMQIQQNQYLSFK